MDIGVPLKDLGAVDIEGLRIEILSLDESAWTLQTHRQTVHEVHRQTESVVLIFTEGNNWPDIEVVEESGWEQLSALAKPIMNRILAEHYPRGGTIIRAMVAKLPAACIIKPHMDRHPSFHAGHRIHVPITSNRRVRFMIDGRPYQFDVGRAYEINNQKTHSVMNKGEEDRITLIFDYVPPDQVLNPTFVNRAVVVE